MMIEPPIDTLAQKANGNKYVLSILASKRAKNRAEAVAKSVPAQLAGIRTMDVSCSANNAVRTQYRMMKSNMMMDTAAGAPEGSSTSIESGVVKIYANVNASFFVK